MVRPVWKTHDSRTARRRWTIRLKAHGSYCSGYIPNCTSLVPGLHKSQTYVGEVYFNFSTVFSDENMFVQVDGNRQATATATDDNTTTPQNLLPHVQNPVQNGGHQPFNQLSVHNTCNTNLTCGGQGVNPFLRNLQYSINPTFNNSTIHFHFYGKQ